MTEHDDLRSRAELLDAFESLHREASELFDSFPADDFFRRPEPAVWSPAENVVHLVKSVQAVARAMGLPKLALLGLFGRSRDGSRPYGEVVRIYLEQLEKGAVARGPYVPGSLAHGDAEETSATRSRALTGWKKAGSSLERALGKWSEAALDRYRLPHPLLGKLTVREMLFFTHYHDLHHLRLVRRCLTPPG